MTRVHLPAGQATTTLSPAEERGLHLPLGEVFLALTMSFGFFMFPDTMPTIAFLAVSAMGFTAVLLAPVERIRRIPVSMPLLIFLAWGMASFAWALDTDQARQTLIRYVPLVLAFTGVMAILPLPRLARGLKAGFWVMVTVTILTLIVDPETRGGTGITGQGLQGWRGAFEHKNSMSMAVVAGLAAIMAFEGRRGVRAFAIALTTVLVLGSRSATGMTGLILVLVGAWWLRNLTWRDRRNRAAYLLLSLAVGLVGVVLLVSVLPSVLGVYGKDETFTGRTDIWSAVWWGIWQHPLRGLGFGGPWLQVATQPVYEMNRRIGFVAAHSHNGYLELWLQLGIIGVVLFASLWFLAVRDAARVLRAAPPVAWWVISVCAVQLVMSLSETPIAGIWVAVLAGGRVIAQRAARGDFEDELYEVLP